MITNKPIQSQESDLKAFNEYLDSIANQPEQNESWEFTVLGGFGGYESQARVSTENAYITKTKPCK